MRTDAILRAVRAWLGFLMVLAMTLPASAARRPALHWTRGPEAGQCIDPLTLTERVEALMGPVFAWPADFAIEGHIERRDQGFFARVAVTGVDRAPQGERVIAQPGPDCRALDEAIVFVIALMIDPDLELERLAREPSLEGRTPGDELLRELDAHPPRPAPLELPPPPPSPPSITPAPPKPYRWEGAMALAVGSETPRGASFGPLLALRLPVARWFEVGAQARVLPRLRGEQLDATRSLRAQTFSLAPLVCLRAPSERVSARVCAGPESSLVHARGRGFDEARSANLHVWNALLVGELTLRLNERWALLLHGYVRRALEAKRLTYESDPLSEGTDSIALARFAGGAALGLMYRFRSGDAGPAGTHLRNPEVTP